MRRSRVLSRARRRSLAVGAVVALGWVVAGCTGGGDPGPSPTVEEPVVASPSETPEPTPTETGPVKPERPAAMERDDAEGAAAAAEYFLELYPYVMATGDTTEWEAMSHPTCQSCADFVAQARTIKQRGDRFAGGGVEATVERPELYARDEATGIFPLDVTLNQAEFAILSPEGEEIHAGEDQSVVRRVEMGRNDKAWVVVAIAELDQ